MTPLLWFHAFRRNNIEDLLAVLIEGAAPTPPSLSNTRKHEEQLELAASTYAYLGRPHGSFGYAAFAIEPAHFSGEMSPFDSGGLTSTITPVCEWPADDDRRHFLKRYTWPTSKMKALVGEYPSPNARLMGAYLRAEKPSQTGPHQIWGGQPVDIWRLNSDCRAWTWEGRCTGAIATGLKLFRWTCAPHDYVQLLDVLERRDLDADFSTYIVSRYVPGGVSFLQETLRDYQMGSQ